MFCMCRFLLQWKMTLPYLSGVLDCLRQFCAELSSGTAWWDYFSTSQRFRGYFLAAFFLRLKRQQTTDAR